MKENEASVSSYDIIRWLSHLLITISIIIICCIWMVLSCCLLWEDKPVPRPCYKLIELLRRHPRPSSRILLNLIRVGIDPYLASVVGGLLVRHMLQIQLHPLHL